VSFETVENQAIALRARILFAASTVLRTRASRRDLGSMAAMFGKWRRLLARPSRDLLRALLIERQIKCGSSVTAFEGDINAFINRHNHAPNCSHEPRLPFEILASVTRLCTRTNAILDARNL
jgi:hypothetical protein